MKESNKAIPPEKLIEQLPEHYTLADRELVQRVYRVAEEAHRDQRRHSGEPYINHCIAVASILADLRVPPEVVAAGLLHDTVEDTSVTLVDIRRDFGDTVANLVNGVTKLTKLPRVSRGDQHAGNEGDGDGNNGSKPPDTWMDLEMFAPLPLVRVMVGQAILVFDDRGVAVFWLRMGINESEEPHPEARRSHASARQ